MTTPQAGETLTAARPAGFAAQVRAGEVLHLWHKPAGASAPSAVLLREADGKVREFSALSGDFQMADDGGFAFAVPFPDGPGVYTVVVWVHARGAHETIAASNVSIRVEAAPVRVSYGSR